MSLMKFVIQDHIVREGWPTYCVSTVELSVEHHGGMWYETYLFPSDGENITEWGEVWGQRYATEPEAMAGHHETVRALKAGELRTWDGETL